MAGGVQENPRRAQAEVIVGRDEDEVYDDWKDNKRMETKEEIEKEIELIVLGEMFDDMPPPPWKPGQLLKKDEPICSACDRTYEACLCY
jgi:hypothetical protein